MSGLLRVEGHTAERQALAAAVAEQRLPNSLLLHGPAGIGKQRVALWLAQLLVCERPTPDGPCDVCHPCRLALRLEHPDLHWFFPLVRPKGSTDRLIEALEEARGAELELRRARPLRPTLPHGMVGIFLAQVQALLRIASTRPAMGSRKVFVVGDAELLVPQEASPEAANALLKLLEEPAADTTLILTASEPDLLLPTIRSRLLPVRLRPLPVTDAARFLEQHADVESASAHRAATLAAGSIGRALGFLPEQGAPGALDEIRLRGRELLAAALDRSAVPRLQAANRESPAAARGGFSDGLQALTLWLRDLAAVAGGAEDVVINTDALDWLRSAARQLPDAGGVPRAIAAVDECLQLTQININPQLATASLLRRLRLELLG